MEIDTLKATKRAMAQKIVSFAISSCKDPRQFFPPLCTVWEISLLPCSKPPWEIACGRPVIVTVRSSRPADIGNSALSVVHEGASGCAVERSGHPGRSDRSHRTCALSLPDDLDQTIVAPVIARYVAFSHLLPASESHHHRGAGGLFRHGLESGPLGNSNSTRLFVCHPCHA